MSIAQSIVFYSMLATFAFLLISYALRLFQLLHTSHTLRQYRKNERYADHGRFIKSENTIPVSILTPVYNEAHTILDTVRNLLSLNFPEYEVIIINDGSEDNTLLLMKLEFELVSLQQPYRRSLKTADIRAIYRSPLYANLIVIDKVHGGKADALNAGINISNYPVFVTMEANSILERDSLVKVIMPFVNDFRVVGLSGMVRIASGWRLEQGQPGDMGLSRQPLICLQTAEYLRTFLTGRIGPDSLGMVHILSGSFGAFNKAAIIEIGGYNNNCMAEDLDLTMRLHQHMLEKEKPYAVKFLTTPVCWTKSPESYRQLLRQRRHWHTKLMDSLLQHKDMLFKKKYGRLGMLALPYYWLFEYMGPLVEVLAYILLLLSWILGAIPGVLALSIFLLVAFFGTILSIASLLLEERSIERYDTAGEMLRLVLYSFLDNLGYRQLNALQCVAAMFSFKKHKRAHAAKYEKKAVEQA